MPWYKMTSSHGPGHQSDDEEYFYSSEDLPKEEMDLIHEDWTYKNDMQDPVGKVRKVNLPPLRILKSLLEDYEYKLDESSKMIKVIKPLIESRKDGILTTDPKKLLQFAVDLNRVYDWTGLSAQLFKTIESYGPHGRRVTRPKNEKTFLEVVKEHVHSKLDNPGDIDPTDEDCLKSLYWMLLGHWTTAMAHLGITFHDDGDKLRSVYELGINRHNITRSEFFLWLDKLEELIPHFPDKED